MILDRAIVRLLPAVPRPIVRSISSRYIAGSDLADATQTVLAMLDMEINRQALMIAYIDDFKAMMIISLLATPLLLLLKKSRGAAPPPVAD